MMDLEKVAEALHRVLKDQQLLLIGRTWKRHKVVHGRGCYRYYKIDDLREFKPSNSKIPTYSGLYAYRLEDEWLYIGMGRCVFDRIKMHLKESCRAGGGKTWQDFFSQKKYQKKLSIYTIEMGIDILKDDNIRIAIEALLQQYYPTAWDKFLESRNKEKQIKVGKMEEKTRIQNKFQ